MTCRRTFAKSAPRVKKSTHRTVEPGDVLHVEIIVWGRPLFIPNGNRYTLAVRDVYTRWGAVVHMARKSDALKALRTFVDTSPMSLKVGTVVFSYSEAVFVARDFFSCIKEKGFVSKASPPFQQWKNGIIEQCWRIGTS